MVGKSDVLSHRMFFRNKSNGIFVLGFFFGFFGKISSFQLARFDVIFLSFTRYWYPQFNMTKYFLCDQFCRVEDCHFGKFGTISARYVSGY